MPWLPQLFARAGSLSDEQAMLHVRNTADHAAFTQLLRRWETPIFRLCIRMSGDEHRGEDLAQETFARVFAHRNTYQPGRKFSTWLWRIALNTCHEETRRPRHRHEHPLPEGRHPSDHSTDSQPGHRAETSERATLLHAALSQLSEVQRTIVLLREYENLKFREIADVLSLPEGTVKWHMAEALNRLSLHLKPLAPDEQPRSSQTHQPKQGLLL
jgi:RNA polymerase sigma-70 factor, ECF subfamily